MSTDNARFIYLFEIDLNAFQYKTHKYSTFLIRELHFTLPIINNCFAITNPSISQLFQKNENIFCYIYMYIKFKNKI